MDNRHVMLQDATPLGIWSDASHVHTLAVPHLVLVRKFSQLQPALAIIMHLE